jgi:hypothetical protein
MQRTDGRGLTGGLRAGAVLTVALAFLGGCQPALQTPTIAVNLPEEYNTPDGMTVDAEGNILLSVPNVNDPNYPPKVVKIGPDDRIIDVIALTGEGRLQKAGPLGIGVGSDGNLYISDNPDFGKDVRTSRLVRVVMKDGKAQKVEVVATGFYNANGLACHGDSVYVCECKIDPQASPMPSGVVRFNLSELDAAKPVALKPGGDDPHFVLKFTTRNPDWKVGANGLGIHGETLYVCNFGDAQLIRAKLGPDGSVVSHEVLAEGQGMLSTDGLSIDRRTGEIYIADFLGNALHKVDPKTGKVTTIARNGDTDGSGGALDRPSEPCVRGDKVYVANIDLPLAGNKTDKPHTVSVVRIRP